MAGPHDTTAVTTPPDSRWRSSASPFQSSVHGSSPLRRRGGTWPLAARGEGRPLGLGIACYVEGTGIGPYEGAHVRVEPSGSIYVATGVTTQGQGHQTTFAQIAADVLGCDPANVTVVTGDTSHFNWGAGTVATR